LRPKCVPNKKPVLQRILEKTEEVPAPEHCKGLGPCLLWKGAAFNHGYGQIRLDGKLQLVHRVVYALRHGEVPAGKDVLHRCDVRRCLQDTHHFTGTHLDNMRDRTAKGRGVTRPLPQDIAEACRERLVRGTATVEELALELGVSLITVRKAVRRTG
jgi:hypothetical protein